MTQQASTDQSADRAGQQGRRISVKRDILDNLILPGGEVANGVADPIVVRNKIAAEDVANDQRRRSQNGNRGTPKN